MKHRIGLALSSICFCIGGLAATHSDAATFGAISGEVRARAGSSTESRNVVQYALVDGSGATGATAFSIDGDSFDSAQASTTPILRSNRSLSISLLANSSTDTEATPQTPRSDAHADFTQSLSIASPQRLFLSASFSLEGANVGSGEASLTLSNANGSQQIALSLAAGNNGFATAVFAAGALTLTASAQSQVYAPGTSKAAISAGSLIVTELADLTGDLRVNGLDFSIWSRDFGRAPSAAVHGDVDNDQKVEGRDFLIWQRQFGDVSPGNAAVAVAAPEPSCSLLAVMGVVGLTRRGRRCFSN